MKYIKNRDNISESNITKEFDIPSTIWEINDILNENGYKLYVVGGAVRDFETGDTPKDFDLCTDALPDDVIRILSPHFRVQLHGEAFAVVVVFTEEEPLGMEIATFRIDVTKGRNPEVKVGGVTIEQDVMRRDLTINGMFFDLETKEIIDLVGGIDDLKNKIIRMIGNPVDRISDDPLRILRVFRFATRYGSILDEKTVEAIHLHNDISSVSMPRVWDRINGEFWKSFNQAKDFQQYLDFLTDFGIMEQILPNLNVDSKINNQDSMVLVLAQMLKNNDIKKLRKVMNKPCSIPSDVIEQVTFLIELLNFDKNRVVDFYKSKVRVKMDNETISKWLVSKNIQDHDTNKFILFTLTINSEDVMKNFNLKPSAELGMKIKELEVEQFDKL